MNSYVSASVGTLMGLGACLAVEAWAGERATAEATAEQQPEEPSAPRVKLSPELVQRASPVVERVEKHSFGPTLDLVGSVHFNADALSDVGGRVQGRIARMLASVGDHVEAGQPLLEIESNEWGGATAALFSAHAKALAAEREAQREGDLGRRGLSSPPVVERAVAEANVLRAEANGAEQRLLAMGLDHGELAALRTREGVRRITLRAPISGEVIARDVVLGQVVGASRSLMRIADLSRVWVELDVFERDLAAVAPGDVAVLAAESSPDRTFLGKVDHLNATVDRATRTGRVRIAIENHERLLRPGQFVHARLMTQGEHRNVIAIPRHALLLDEGGEPFVFLAAGADTYVVRHVRSGPVHGELVEILQGLGEGDLLVTEGGCVLKGEIER